VVGRLPKAQAALEFAREQHAGQCRTTDGAPFIEHPLEVGWLLYGAGAQDPVIAAGLLHDVLEKTPVTDAELRRRFGVAIARLVSALTEDEGISGYVRRKAALRQQAGAAGSAALTIFAADKVSKVRELRAAASEAAGRCEPVDRSLVPPRRLAHFRNCLGLLEERLGDTALVKLLRTELAGLDDDLRAGAALARVS
jgi:(p)ppGpp synthase/HD superfamily hydrolase